MLTIQGGGSCHKFRFLVAIAVVILCATTEVEAHEHHDDRIPEGAGVSEDPIDKILWIHILVQILSWGLLFPTGMVLGVIRSRWHVPVQTLGSIGAVVGYFLGHAHKGRQFSRNIHSASAPGIYLLLIIEVVLGAYLRLHIERGFLGNIRRWLVVLHGTIGKVLPVAAWVQMLFGGITAMGYCRGDHLGQCLAHFIMGSAFIGYGIVLTILLLVGQLWLRRTGHSQEFFDSLIIAAWGCVNTFTEHRWGGPWVANDLQHTTMGIVWWCAGLLGIWLSRKRDGRPKRNLIPAIVILLTGWGMSAHPQDLPLSTMVHTIFGYTLMLAGVTRIVEISFVLKDRDAISYDGSEPSSFQHLPPFLLYASGFLFMGATEEQMAFLSAAHVTHVSYVLILYSIAFMLYLFVNFLLHIYAVHAFPVSTKPHVTHPSRHSSLKSRRHHHRGNLTSDTDVPDIEAKLEPFTDGQVNGHLNGFAHKTTMSEDERRKINDAQEFELDALISDDDDDRGLERGKRKHDLPL